ncbi:sulfurtransferase [Paenibacillus flagellatus]|uniref:Sulfurtransferase n=1 Tax=Paenibacillus flagellatus TaxID=2211139 RepID=A0A2V5K1W9_9BACL|nr:sulfurtransferase [Paenibacillus flagellatus]PYI52632.1 sulfurtransferase [Paenibacillus flagellatus]
MGNLVEFDWLREHLDDPNVVVADCRFALGKPESGKAEYDAGHIRGAVYFDLERDLSGPKDAHGGRHPLPDLQSFASVLGRAGIDATKTVVAYDDQGGAMASRLWWMLRYVGHDDVKVLNGGYGEWKAAGYPVSAEVPQPAAVTFVPAPRPEMLLSMEDVKARLGRPGTTLIDSREPKRYAGLEEPIDPVGGHIPGAVNRFWKDALGADGRWQGAEAQKARFAGLNADDELVVYCGSGVTACPNVLALTEAGFRNVKLYGGSWSDWISYADNPIATGEEE